MRGEEIPANFRTDFCMPCMFQRPFDIGFRWENRAASLNSEVIVDTSNAYQPPLPVNPDNPQAWFSISAQGRSLGVVQLELKVTDCAL